MSNNKSGKKQITPLQQVRKALENPEVKIHTTNEGTNNPNPFDQFDFEPYDWTNFYLVPAQGVYHITPESVQSLNELLARIVNPVKDKLRHLCDETAWTGELRLEEGDRPLLTIRGGQFDYVLGKLTIKGNAEFEGGKYASDSHIDQWGTKKEFAKVRKLEARVGVYLFPSKEYLEAVDKATAITDWTEQNSRLREIGRIYHPDGSKHFVDPRAYNMWCIMQGLYDVRAKEKR